jgi:acetyl esterase/lipase
MAQHKLAVLGIKYANCPHCGRRIGFFQRIAHCALTEELVCSKCIVNERFSDAVAEKIPEEFRQKFRILDVLVFIGMGILVFSLLITAWPSFAGWDLGNTSNLLNTLLRTLGQWIAAFVLMVIWAKLPHASAWVFYWWIQKPKNRELIENAMKAQEKGEYTPWSKLYQTKLHIIEALKKSKLKFLFIITIGANALMIPFFFIVRFIYTLAGSWFSVIVGIIYVIALITGVFTLFAGALFYSKKAIENRKQRRIIELLSWVYALLTPVIFLSFIMAHLIRYELMDGTFTLANTLEVVHQICFVIQALAIIYLAFLLFKATPDYNWKANEENAPSFQQPTLKMLYPILKGLVIILVVSLLIVALVLTMELMIADFAMAICVTSYYLVLMYAVIIFAALKLIQKTPRPLFKYRLNYWTIVKISGIIMVANLLPLTLTTTWSNPDIEGKFNQTFGSNWQSQITPQEYARMHAAPFSWFDAYFGYSVPINAQYENVYMLDHPRYVKYGNGTILSNGTSKYANITQKMIFDAYLPATPEFDITFGDGKADKLPVVIYLHGIGMDRGAGNANWTTQYIANLGYAVFDMSYGFTGWVDYPYNGGKERGYDVPDTIQQIGVFTKFLENNSQYYHADVSNMYFAGRSFGGWMALSCGLALNTPIKGNYSSNVTVKGIIPFYPASDIPSAGSELFGLGEVLGLTDKGAPYIRGSSDPKAVDYNPEWQWYDPLWIAKNATAGTLPPILAIQGTHDYMVPQGAVKRIEKFFSEHNHKVIACYYPFGSHGFDALHWSPYGQSILYYEARFLALTH